MGISEYAHELGQQILKSLYDGLYSACEDAFNNLFSSFNNSMQKSADQLTQSPKSWNGGAFNLVQSIADNACIPIAGVIITIIFCWEIIHLTQEANNMNAAKPDVIFMELIKLIVCLLVCGHSFEIVMAFYDIGAYATSQITGSSIGSFGDGLDLSSLLPKITGDYTVYDLLRMVANLLCITAARAISFACGIIIYLRVMLWFLELFIYSSVAPIPFATFGNKEWSQMGMNYIRKMLAVCFEGFFMLLVFALYGGCLANIQQSGGTFIESMFSILGCGILLIILLFKTGNISASIFNAH